RLAETDLPTPHNVAAPGQSDPPALPQPKTQYKYDNNGNQVAVIDIVNHIETDYQHDHQNRLIQTNEPNSVSGVATNANGTPAGAFTKDGYNAVGDQTSFTDELGHVTTSIVDGLDRVVKTIAAAPNTAFDLLNNLGQAASPVTRTIYDAVGNVLATIDPNRNA